MKKLISILLVLVLLAGLLPVQSFAAGAASDATKTSAASETAQTETRPIIRMVSQSASFSVVSEDGTAQFSVAAETDTGIPVSYQWQSIDETNLSWASDRTDYWKNLDGETDGVLILSGITDEEIYESEYANLRYRCVITAEGAITSYSRDFFVLFEEPEMTVTSVEVTYENPVYAESGESETTETKTATASQPTLSAEKTDFKDNDGAIAEMRQCMVNREESFTIYLKTSIQDYSDAFNYLLAQATSYTGNPKEGDYLGYQYGNVNASGSVNTYSGDSLYYDIFNFSFSVKTGNIITNTDGSKKYETVAGYYTTAEQEAEMDDLVSDAITAMKLSSQESSFAKASKIYSYITSHVVYATADLNSFGTKQTAGTLTQADYLIYTGYYALKNGTAVCQGISVLFYRLALECGLPARVIQCVDMCHAWNVAQMDDGNYYSLDATWDLYSSNSGDYRFFLRGTDFWTNTSSGHRGYLYVNGVKTTTVVAEVGQLRPEGNDVNSCSGYNMPAEDLVLADVFEASLPQTAALGLNIWLLLTDNLAKDSAAYLTFNDDSNTKYYLKDAASETVSTGTTEYSFKRMLEYSFTVPVNPADAEKAIQINVYDGEGSLVKMVGMDNAYSTSGTTYTLESYIQTMAGGTTTPEQVKSLVESLSDYCTYASAQLNGSEVAEGAVYQADTLSAITASSLEEATTHSVGTMPDGISFEGCSLLLDSEITLRFVFRLEDGSEISNLLFTDGSGNTLTPQLISDGKLCTVDYTGYTADALNQYATVNVQNTSADTSGTISISPLGYAYLVLQSDSDETMVHLAQALTVYSQTAESFYQVSSAAEDENTLTQAAA